MRFRRAPLRPVREKPTRRSSTGASTTSRMRSITRPTLWPGTPHTTKLSEPEASAPPPPGAAPDLDAIIAAYREATSLARFSWAPYLSDPKLERRLGRITAPTLVVAPSDDRLIPVAHARRYAALIGGADYAEVAECGHAMHVERPAEFAALVASFLAAHPLAPLSESGVSR